MNDELRLSLHLDGRLPDEERPAFERRLAAEPALRARLAAVLALAATHAGVYWAGARQGAEAQRAVRRSIEATEALLDRAAGIDIAAPPEELRTEIATLRREIPTRLVALSRAGEPEAARLADALAQIDTALETPRTPDPAFLCLQVKAIVTALDGSARLRLVPATATSYATVLPAGEGRYQVLVVEDVSGTPRTIVYEGTPEELEARQGFKVRPPSAPKRR